MKPFKCDLIIEVIEEGQGYEALMAAIALNDACRGIQKADSFASHVRNVGIRPASVTSAIPTAIAPKPRKPRRSARRPPTTDNRKPTTSSSPATPATLTCVACRKPFVVSPNAPKTGPRAPKYCKNIECKRARARAIFHARTASGPRPPASAPGEPARRRAIRDGIQRLKSTRHPAPPPVADDDDPNVTEEARRLGAGSAG